MNIDKSWRILQKRGRCEPTMPVTSVPTVNTDSHVKWKTSGPYAAVITHRASEQRDGTPCLGVT